MKKLSALQSFNAMVEFLERYYLRTSNDVIGLLLSDMLFLPDGDTADPAVWEEWSEGVNKILKRYISKKIYSEDTKELLSKTQAFDAMIKFFENYCHITDSDEAKDFLEQLQNGGTDNQKVFEEWNKVMTTVLSRDAKARRYLVPPSS